MKMRKRCMVVFGLVLLLCSNTVYGARLRRRIDEFGEMILLKTDRNPMDFNGYGNWCGFGGKGGTVDDIDACCKAHDECYERINDGSCETLLKYKIYTTEYRWSFKNGNIVCHDDDTCAKQLCECDHAASICFGKYQAEYNTQNKHNGIIKGLSRLVGLNG
ncbi:Phospholipase A2 [Mactra antiquata]